MFSFKIYIDIVYYGIYTFYDNKNNFCVINVILDAVALHVSLRFGVFSKIILINHHCFGWFSIGYKKMNGKVTE